MLLVSVADKHGTVNGTFSRVLYIIISIKSLQKHFFQKEYFTLLDYSNYVMIVCLYKKLIKEFIYN